jgi:hypothetical protein
MASSICSLQGLRPGGQCHPRLCSLQSIVQVDEINEIPALDNEINLPDIFDNLDDGDLNQCLDLHHHRDYQKYQVTTHHCCHYQH